MSEKENAAIGVDISKEDQVMTLLCNLPHSHKNLVISLGNKKKLGLNYFEHLLHGKFDERWFQSKLEKISQVISEPFC